MPQPILPAPVPLTDMERAYREDEPAGLFPPNQDSNFGQYRKNLTDTLQDVANQIDLLLNEKFISTSTQFLSYHEEEAGLPSLLLQTIQYRQNRVQTRLTKGLFSRARRNAIIESFITATSGAPTSIGTGIPIGSGLTLYSGVSTHPASYYYKVIEDIPNYHYYVYVDASLGVDMAGLLGELGRVTPGGIGFTVYLWSNNKTGGGISLAKAGASSHHP